MVKIKTFTCSIGAYDGAKFCEFVCLFLLKNLRNKFDKNSIGLHGDEGHSIFKNVNDYQADKIREKFRQAKWDECNQNCM